MRSFRHFESRLSEVHRNVKQNKPSFVKSVVIAVTVTGVVLFIVLVFILLLWYRKFSRSNTRKDDGASCNLHKFSYRELKRATNCFHHSQKLGKGGFGVVYRGVLRNGREVAVKKLVLSSLQGEREFQNELSICKRLDSRHVVKLLGFSSHGENVRLLVYELMQNRSLQEALLDKNLPVLLDWEKRFNVILDIAKALAFLHLECEPPIIHGDVKPSNVLLDRNFSAYIADFGLARLKTEELGRGSSMSFEKYRQETPEKAAPETPKKIGSEQGSQPPEPAERHFGSRSKGVRVNAACDRNDGRPDVLVELPVASQEGREFVENESLPSSYVGSPHGVLRYLSDAQGDSEIPGSMILPLGSATFPRADAGASDAAPRQGVQNGDLRRVVDDSGPLPPARKSHHKTGAGKDWWWRQEHSGEMKVRDYVMEWIGSELTASDRNVELKRGASVERTVTKASESKSDQGGGDSKSRKEKVKGKSKGTRKSREWWKDEYFAELSRKKEEAPPPGRGKGRGRRRKGARRQQAAAMKGGEWRGSSDGTPPASGGVSGFGRPHEAAGEIASDGERHSGGELSRDVSSATSMRGTVCYVAPEYGGGGGVMPSEPSDVYSFGVLLLVIISGRRPIEFNPNPATGASSSSASPLRRFHRANLISWARRLAYTGNLLDLVDQRLLGCYHREQVLLCITLALLCIQRVPTTRPTIAHVLKILLGELPPPPFPLEFSPSPPSRISYHSPLRAASLVSSDE